MVSSGGTCRVRETPNGKERKLAPRTTERGTLSSSSSPRTRRGGRLAVFLDKATPVTLLPAPLPSGARRERHADTSCLISVVVSGNENSRPGVRRLFSVVGLSELSKKRLNETESERGALRGPRMLDEPLITRALPDDDAVVRSRSIYRCALRRYPFPAPVASFLPRIVDTRDLENTQRRRRGVRGASPAQELERKAKEPRKPRLRGHR